jgi:Arc/MetJ family transcription regulator
VDAGLVGRDREVAALDAWLDGATTEGGRVVLVGGEAGIGKSRLLAAAAAHARTLGRPVLWGRTTEQDGAPPYRPWLQVLEPIGARGRLEAPPGPDPESERFRRFEAVSQALVTAATATGAGPLLVVVEDVHRADSASLLLLAHIADRLAGAPVVLVVTFRPSPLDQVAGFAAAVDDIARLPHAGRLDLRGLDAAAVGRLLGAAAATAGPDAGSGSAVSSGVVPAEVVERVAAATGGNPLFVGELARHLAAGGDLADVPGSVRDAVAVRLAARSEGCVEAVRVGAVIGRTFAAGRVATATGQAAMRCLEHLDEAVRAGLIEPTGVPGELRFVHALVRDAVEATIGAAELPVRHRRLAGAIETYDGTGDAQVPDLARHWDASSVLGERDVAAAWCERAAVLADRQLAWEEAARLFERALVLGGGGSAGAPLHEHRRAIGAARARLHFDEIAVTMDRCRHAADAARRAGPTWWPRRSWSPRTGSSPPTCWPGRRRRWPGCRPTTTPAGPGSTGC